MTDEKMKTVCRLQDEVRELDERTICNLEQMNGELMVVNAKLKGTLWGERDELVRLRKTALRLLEELDCFYAGTLSPYRNESLKKVVDAAHRQLDGRKD